MLTHETKPSDFKNIRGGDYRRIKGWVQMPTLHIPWPTNEEHKGYTWERPEQQNTPVDILKSVERPNLTAVYSTSTPPSGLSGIIRRFAFKYSQSNMVHWLPLILADRVLTW